MTVINICDYSMKNNVGVTRIFTKMKLRRCTMSENRASMNSFPDINCRASIDLKTPQRQQNYYMENIMKKFFVPVNAYNEAHSICTQWNNID
mmetsp:Transcript_20290/g.26231  ORF Transcript_20290/g.26231 Transcript_20290/m.26231 type:complete len:92 (+) Transcript_20290:9-284(+)